MLFLKRKEAPSVCPKTCKHDGNTPARRGWSGWIFPITGLIALIWFLIRIVPKPSRATYPCQRVALPLASGFVIWLLGLAGSVIVFRKAERYIARARYVVGVLCVSASVGIVWLVLGTTEHETIFAAAQTPNAPIGVAKGIHPGRVVWIHDPNATDWDGYNSPKHWYERNHTDQAVVHKMVSRAICGLAGESSDAEAWDAIFRYFNRSRGKGDVGYSPGEKIAFKVNNTLSYNADSKTFAKKSNNRNRIGNSPQMTIALLWQLVYVVGVNEPDITIGDPTRIMPNFYYDMVQSEFPDVCYMANLGGLGRTQVEFSDIEFYWSTRAAYNKRQDYLPRSFAEADYLINFSILKSHGTAGVTVCAKNHYGSLLRTPVGSLWNKTYDYYNMHDSLAKNTPGMGHYRCLVDLMGHSELGGKTVLHIVDGLFGGYDWFSEPRKWKMSPFNDDWPSSIFVSGDPVAIDSVCYDFLWTEWSDWPRISGADDYLHEAALADDPPSGTSYDPDSDGLGLASLGVHEHWNNSLHKQYSRNRGSGNGIELTSPVRFDFNGDGIVDFTDLMTLTHQWMQNTHGLSTDIIQAPAGDRVVNLKDFALFAKYWLLPSQ